MYLPGGGAGSVHPLAMRPPPVLCQPPALCAGLRRFAGMNVSAWSGQAGSGDGSNRLKAPSLPQRTAGRDGDDRLESHKPLAGAAGRLGDRGLWGSCSAGRTRLLQAFNSEREAEPEPGGKGRK